jgi:hypothetical protein
MRLDELPDLCFPVKNPTSVAPFSRVMSFRYGRYHASFSHISTLKSRYFSVSDKN